MVHRIGDRVGGLKPVSRVRTPPSPPLKNYQGVSDIELKPLLIFFIIGRAGIALAEGIRNFVEGPIIKLSLHTIYSIISQKI